ncbi:malonate decarboxylase holo-ACP synthase [Mycobacterium yunnanensis]|uniref:Malonate decarboxylase holo-ACP synthase n=1 Tax=Mycobacterium yunnanensis TaxID=368477 RepID=A0A9X2Z2Q1_9MYCO|nr:malonate decarboxylase holo-ACP synthase [Mycobacterium yunnanensis]MCV7422448.1 malonate decarboxylase holo-ACP synthase [Mycobacterium yunnanensis]
MRTPDVFLARPHARPHDLLRVDDPEALSCDAPAWVADALARTPWVVVRRDRTPDGVVPVGVRGSERSQRHGTVVAVDDVVATVSPEALVVVTGRELPAIRALRQLRPLLAEFGWPWGPTGSVGFELATGHPTVTPDSDLDLLVRVSDVRRALPALETLAGAVVSAQCRVDCQVETPDGAAALAELVGDGPEVLVRTDEGPRLVDRGAIR